MTKKKPVSELNARKRKIVKELTDFNSFLTSTPFQPEDLAYVASVLDRWRANINKAIHT